MSATFFHIVNEHVARNPVARAVRSAKLAAAIREFQLQLYYLADDTTQNDNLLAAAKVIAVALRLHEVTGLLARVRSNDGLGVCLIDATDVERTNEGF